MNAELLLHFIRKYYVVHCYSIPSHSKSIEIVIKDIGDGIEGEKVFLYNLNGKDINFIWNKGKKITGIQLYDKRWAKILPTKIKQVFKHERTTDLFKTLIREKIPCIIPINEIPWEFPNLFDENNGLQEAVRNTST